MSSMPSGLKTIAQAFQDTQVLKVTRNSITDILKKEQKRKEKKGLPEGRYLSGVANRCILLHTRMLGILSSWVIHEHITLNISSKTPIFISNHSIKQKSSIS